MVSVKFVCACILFLNMYVQKKYKRLNGSIFSSSPNQVNPFFHSLWSVIILLAGEN